MPADTSTMSTVPFLIRCATSAPRGNTVTCLVIGLVAHQRSLATSTTEPSCSTDCSLYGPDDGNHRRLTPGLRSQMVFHASAIRDTIAASLFSSAVVTSMPSRSANTCDGIIDVAVNSCG